MRTSMAEGWTVRVDRANNFEATTLYDVVTEDSRHAEILVRDFAACAKADKVRAVAPLTRTTIDAHELKKDEVKQWPNGKVHWSKD